MSEGSPPDAMYVVTDGELEVSRHSGGADLLLNVCGPGDLIGELGVAHGRPRSATVRARGAGAGAAHRRRAPSTACSPTRPSARALLTADLAPAGPRGGPAPPARADGRARRAGRRPAARGEQPGGGRAARRLPAARPARRRTTVRSTRCSRSWAACRCPTTRSPGRTPRPRVAGALSAGGVEGGWSAAADLVRLGRRPGGAGRRAGRPARRPARRRRAGPGPRRGDPGRAGGGVGRRGLPVEDRLRRPAAGLRRRPVADRGRRARRPGAVARAGAAQGAAGRAGRPRLRSAAQLVVEGWAADLAMVWTNLLDNALAAVGRRGRGHRAHARRAGHGRRRRREHRADRCRPRCWRGRSTRSTRPSRSARAPAWAWRRRSPSSRSGTRAGSRSPRRTASPAPGSSCPAPALRAVFAVAAAPCLSRRHRRQVGRGIPMPRTSRPPSQATTTPVVAAAFRARGQLHVVAGVVLRSGQEAERRGGARRSAPGRARTTASAPPARAPAGRGCRSP